MRPYLRLSEDRSVSWLLALAVLAISVTYVLVSSQAAPAALALFDSPASPVATDEPVPTTAAAEASSVTETVPEDTAGIPAWIIVGAVVVVVAIIAVVVLTRRR